MRPPLQRCVLVTLCLFRSVEITRSSALKTFKITSISRYRSCSNCSTSVLIDPFSAFIMRTISRFVRKGRSAPDRYCNQDCDFTSPIPRLHFLPDCVPFLFVFKAGKEAYKKNHFHGVEVNAFVISYAAFAKITAELAVHVPTLLLPVFQNA